MTPEEKKSLAEAFRTAVAKRTDADEASLLCGFDDVVKTPRQLVEENLADERFYSVYDKILRLIELTPSKFASLVGAKELDDGALKALGGYKREWLTQAKNSGPKQ